MVVCQFFLINRCKFGQNCRNEHTAHGGGSAQRSLFGGPSQTWQQTGGSHRVTFKDTFGTNGQGSTSQYKWMANQQTGQQNSAMDLVNGLPKEMESWEKSHMWSFSCFAVDKNLPSLPDFYDICPEELRFEAYQAMKSANVQSYTDRVQSLQCEFENRRRQLQHMTIDLKSKLVAVTDEAIKKRQTQSTSSDSMVFGSTKSTQQFIKENQISTCIDLGKSTSGNSNSGLFGKSSVASRNGSSISFGKSTSGCNFGRINSGLENCASFGSPGPSHLDKPAGASIVFGNKFQGQNFQTHNQFGVLNQNNTTSLFGQAQQTSHLIDSVSNNTTDQSLALFGSSPLVSQLPSLFGQFATNTGQGINTCFPHGSVAPATQSSLFGTPLNQNHPPTTLFGKPFTDKMPSTSVHNIFDHHSSAQVQPNRDMAEQNQSSVFGGSSTVGQGSHYTPLEDLSEHEKEAFCAKAFELGRIPIRPPPKQMIS